MHKSSNTVWWLHPPDFCSYSLHVEFTTAFMYDRSPPFFAVLADISMLWHSKMRNSESRFPKRSSFYTSGTVNCETE